jgi:hypothetical protein
MLIALVFITGHNTLSGWNQLYFDISLYWVVFEETGAFFSTGVL